MLPFGPLPFANIIDPLSASGGQLHGWRLFIHWSWMDFILIFPITAALLYARGLRRWPREQRTLRHWAPVSFYSGVGLIMLSLGPPLDALVQQLFFLHMVQHMALFMIGPALILLGAPTVPILKGLPGWARRGALAPLMRSRAVRATYRAMTHPTTVLLLYMGNLWVWHLLGQAYVSATRNQILHVTEHWAMASTAIFFWGVVIDPKPVHSRLAHGLRAFYLFAAMFSQVLLSAFISFREYAIYPYYASLDRLWGISAIDDQQLAAMVMWIGGTTFMGIAFVVVILQWLNHEENRTKAREAEQDRISLGGAL